MRKKTDKGTTVALKLRTNHIKLLHVGVNTLSNEIFSIKIIIVSMAPLTIIVNNRE